jgi:chaperonin GroES
MNPRTNTPKSTREETGPVAALLQPLGDRLLVEPVEEEASKPAGILIPDSAKEKPTEGIVRVLGTGKINDEGKRIGFDVKVGDRVLTSKYGGTEVQLEKKDYRILRSEDILGWIE